MQTFMYFGSSCLENLEILVGSRLQVKPLLRTRMFFLANCWIHKAKRLVVRETRKKLVVD